MLVISCNQVFIVKASYGFDLGLTETASVSVNCTTAQVSTMSMVMSYNTSLVHSPSGVDMGRTELMNATGISLIFSTVQSFLIYLFNNTNLATARSFADAVKPSIQTAFGTSFTWSATGQNDSQVNVTYTGSGKANLTQYTEWLMSQCGGAPDLGGFSLTFLPMTHEPGAFSSVSAYKEVGGFDWAYSMMTGYVMSIPKGSGNHRIDILDLLDVDSLAPSPYANVEDTYTSNVMLTISSNQTITYVSSEPGLVSPEQPRGWMSIPFTPPNTLIYYFSFADDPSPVSPLSLTFSGIVIPEFTTLLSVILLILTAIIAVVMRKRFLQMPNKKFQ